MRRSPFGMPETPWNWRRCADRSVGCAPFGEDLGHGGGLTDGGCGFERAEGQPCEVLSGAKKVGRFQKAEAAQARPCEDFALLSPQAMRPAQCEVHLLCSQDVGTISHGGVRPPEARGLQAKDSLQSQPKWMLQWHSGRERERELERERESVSSAFAQVWHKNTLFARPSFSFQERAAEGSGIGNFDTRNGGQANFRRSDSRSIQQSNEPGQTGAQSVLVECRVGLGVLGAHSLSGRAVEGHGM